MKISTFTYKGIDIEVTFNNGFLAYSFELEGAHGYKMAVKPRATKMEIVNATALLIINAIETIETIWTQNNLNK